MNDYPIEDLATWQPDHPEGTKYFVDWNTGKVTARLPDGTEITYQLSGRVQ